MSAGGMSSCLVCIDGQTQTQVWRASEELHGPRRCVAVALQTPGPRPATRERKQRRQSSSSSQMVSVLHPSEMWDSIFDLYLFVQNTLLAALCQHAEKIKKKMSGASDFCSKCFFFFFLDWAEINSLFNRTKSVSRTNFKELISGSASSQLCWAAITLRAHKWFLTTINLEGVPFTPLPFNLTFISPTS